MTVRFWKHIRWGHMFNVWLHDYGTCASGLLELIWDNIVFMFVRGGERRERGTDGDVFSDVGSGAATAALFLLCPLRENPSSLCHPLLSSPLFLKILYFHPLAAMLLGSFWGGEEEKKREKTTLFATALLFMSKEVNEQFTV